MTPAILDHLWQSTLLALGAALLTLAFRRASAGVRHGLWFAASVKFLVPFAALAALGSLLAPAVHAPAVAAPEAAFVAQAAQPFSQAVFSQVPLSHPALPQASLSPTYSAAAPVHAAPHLDLGLILMGVWALGCALVLARWMVRSARVRSAVRSATPLSWPAPMPVLASTLLWEPGLVGLWRPVLVVPESLPDYLAPAEIDAIVAHEVCHLRRRDNLAAALHMLVEALFWFHPLVWWIGGRLIEERERACDETVVRTGHDRAAYARSLVECCRLYLQSPLPCVAGASGSNLKTRVETIMTAPLSLPLSAARKTLLIAAGVCALATPVAAGLLTSPGGLKAAAHAVAVASGLSPARLDDARSDPESAPEGGGAAAITLARIKAILAPDLSVAASDAPPLPLAQDVPMRLATLAPIPSAAQPLASAPAQAIPPSTPLAQMAGPADAAQALSFVRSYAAATRERHMIARWGGAICVGVTGLAPDQAAAVRARVEAVAGAVGAAVQPAGCRVNVDVRFSAEPQHVLDDVIAHKAWLLGDSTSDTKAVKTVTLPVQAWYQTNGVEFAAARANSLKALVSYQAPADQTYQQSIPPAGMLTPPAPPLAARQFLNVLMIVDPRRTGTKDLGLISDDVAMLALSQPRAFDHCNVLPSVTDLFAGACPGRGAPTGLTAADGAYLAALYAADPVGRAFESQQQGIARRMVETPIAAPQRDVLLNQRAAVRPRAALARPPSAPVAQAAEPGDAKLQALRFVQSYAAATPQRHMIARWGNSICIQVAGLTPDQAAAVRARVAAVAKAVGVGVLPVGCQRVNVEIGFSTEPQLMLDNVIARQADLLGDRTSDTKSAKTAVHPIQAWYVTNGMEFADIDHLGAMNIRVDYQDPGYFTTGPGATGDGSGNFVAPSPAPSARPLEARQFLNVMVIVDLRRTQDMSLGLISDYVAMLALSQPRSLDGCNVLPSVTDLFAGACPGRGEPHGLTPADDAYLTALYAADPVGRVFESQQADIARHMVHPQIGLAQGAILSNPRVVVR